MKKAFTMIELIFAIVIIGILSAVALPNFFDLKFKSDIASLKSEIEGINGKINAQLLKNVMVGQVSSFETLDNLNSSGKPIEPDKIFTALFKDGLDRGDENKGWLFLARTIATSDKAYSAWTDLYNPAYKPDKDFQDYLDKEKKDSKFIDKEKMELYKYTFNSNIYYKFIYRSIKSELICVEAVCNKCNKKRIDSINNIISCIKPAS
ncbi:MULTISPECIES: type II secretion system protein [unclassified Campylobacter]|uniref:type II secretion system protein n=1 Tax=unclassified Campylobacter TaxID=2593542 RepID=UPI0032F07A72